MAWHDNKWNGTICKHPDQNDFCTGNHSLLSERLQREKKVDIETLHAGEKLDSVPGYLPPCFWSANAFSSIQSNVVHVHPFRSLKGKKIDETLYKSSIFTWPFRLAFNHSNAKEKVDGSYRPDLEAQVKRYFAKFKTPDESSLVFFYLNHDNYVSTEEFEYVLVGCARIKDIRDSTSFTFSKSELDYWTSLDGMQNFPIINWAIQVSYGFEKTGVRLPYHEYIDYLESHPAEEDKLDEMKVRLTKGAIF